jgi:hypothetical protein
MRRINDVTFAKGLRCNGKTGVDTALNAVLELYAECAHPQLVASFRLVPNLSGSRARRGFLMGGSGSVKVQIYGRGE